MLKIILVRHGESTANAKGILQGQKVDESLSELGKAQAKKLAEALREEKIEAIISSDLKRAKETAEEISRITGKKIILDKRIREKDHETEKGEDVKNRCADFLEELKKYSGTIVVVSHGGPNRKILAISKGNRKEDFEFFSLVEQNNTCINRISYENGIWTVHVVNDTSHIK